MPSQNAEPSKAEMLAAAKAALGDKKPEGNEHELTGLDGATVVVVQSDLPDKPVLAIKGNRKSTFELRCQVIKILVQGCTDCVIRFPRECKITTGTVEVWECDRVTLAAEIRLDTVQLDISGKLAVELPGVAQLGQIVQAGVAEVALTFPADSSDAGRSKVLDYAALAALAPGLSADDRTTQFTTRWVDGEVLTEEVIRLANDFPTTAREKAKHDKDILAKEAALRQMAEQVLGGAGSGLDQAEAAELRSKVEETQATHAQELEVGTGLEARVEFKRKLGNEQFGLKDYQQAAVHYTDALSLKDDNAPIYANRAMCWLKLAQAEKALADCDKCLELDPKYVKAHFRRGVALLELDRFVDACKAFRTTLDLDPKNAQAKSSMMLAEKKLQMMQQRQ